MSYSVPPGHPTHPRIDLVKKDGSVAVGTPTVGANLENRLGMADHVPADEIAYYVLVAAGSTSIHESTRMLNVWTTDINADVERIESDLAARRNDG